MNVQFLEVGRNKVSWTEKLNQKPTEAVLARLVKRKKCLMSSDVWCEFDEDMEYGTVFAGMRSVGAFRVTAQETGAGT